MVLQHNDHEYLRRLRHSAAHLLAAAVLKLWPDAKPTIGPATDDGFYYDFEFPRPISAKDLPAIEKKMRELVQSWTAFSHREVSVEEAKNFFNDNSYKLELIDEIAERGRASTCLGETGELITVYTAGDFVDLCRGEHVDHPYKELTHFKLLSVAGAYWRGDKDNPMLIRIYGTAFASRDSLETHLTQLAEAKKRDHRKLGKQLDLFTFSPLVGSGLPLFTPRGTFIRRALEVFVQELQEPRGYQPVWIPHVTKAELYKTSGHWEKFYDHLFQVKGDGETEFVIKPMNCPHHTQIYAARSRSYRDLPLRFSEVTTVYRDEQPGELLGLTRVRSITQDDAHVFCTPDQIRQEIETALSIIKEFYSKFSFGYTWRLSLKDSRRTSEYLGSADIWERAQSILRDGLVRLGVPDFSEAEGEAAFYGPKIDLMARDSLGRDWQLATIQLDFNMPRRFGLTYVDADGQEKTPVMIHRAITGSLERFMAILLEHYAGALPLWLSPTHIAVLPISHEQQSYGHQVAHELRKEDHDIRVTVDDRSESIGKKIREAQLMKVPVMAIVGKQEVAQHTVSKRTREGGNEGTVTVVDLQKHVLAQIAQRI